MSESIGVTWAQLLQCVEDSCKSTGLGGTPSIAILEYMSDFNGPQLHRRLYAALALISDVVSRNPETLQMFWDSASLQIDLMNPLTSE